MEINPQWWRIVFYNIKLAMLPQPRKHPFLRIERDIVSGQSANCLWRVQIGFTVAFIGGRRSDGKQGWQLGLFAPTHGHSDMLTGYRRNKFYLYGPDFHVVSFYIPNAPRQVSTRSGDNLDADVGPDAGPERTR